MLGRFGRSGLRTSPEPSMYLLDIFVFTAGPLKVYGSP